MSIHGLFIGCNYKGESYELPDCEMDSQGLADAFKPYLATSVVLNGKSATRTGMIAALDALKKKCKKGDLALVSFSGHGTTDTVNGLREQGIVANDGVVVYEKEVRARLAVLDSAAMLADSCYSGGLPRGTEKRQARTVPMKLVERPANVDLPAKAPPKPHALYLACRYNETAASTGDGGAMTLAVLDAFKKRKDSSTFASLSRDIKKLLPNTEYNQHPQFACADAAFANRTLKSFNKTWNKKPRDK